jgi:diguanylate cyclase (GGDEF)-like protein
MALPYCEKYGFDAARIAQRLEWLQLAAEDHDLARQLQEDVIQPYVGDIVTDFYAWLRQLPAAQALLGDSDNIERLKQTQSGYLLSLGLDFDQADYFESRLRVGQAHVWVGLSLSLYQSAYRYLNQLIQDRVNAHSKDVPRLMPFMHKIIALDMSLAIETYHEAQVKTLEETLQRTQVEQRALAWEAKMDSLTGLANHETIMLMLEESLFAFQAAPTKENKAMAAVMIDIDHFKLVNDNFGHLVGDKVLTEVARRMRSGLRDFDNIGRYGGEEFLLVLNGADLDTARKVAERVRQHVSSGPINLQGLEIDATISLGISDGRLGDSADGLVGRADEALYAAKQAGRNCVRVA